MKGFTLVEVLVALVVIEVGLLGVVGVLWAALRTTERAWMLETGVAAVEAVADSLGAFPAEPGAESRAVAAGTLRWTVTEERGFVVSLVTPFGDSLAVAGRALGGRGGD